MPEVVCPAGVPVEELSEQGRLCGGCVCRVTESLITPVTDPTTFHRRCTQLPGFAVAKADDGELVSAPDGYTACTVWRMAKLSRFAKRFTEGDQDWFQLSASGNRVEYMDHDKRAPSMEEMLAES